MSKKVLIASDSTTDLSAELIKKNNIQILPLGINLGDMSYSDGVDIDPDMIYEHYEKHGELPKTAAANVSDFIDFFKGYVDQGYAIVMFTLSQSMSSTFNNGRMAAEEFEDVYVVDTKNLSTGGGLLVLAAADMAAQGMEAAEIAANCAELAERVDASFIVDDLEFLHKGGRCSALAAFGANLLQLKPCIMVRDGKMGVGKKYRGKFAAVLEKYIDDQLADIDNIELDRIFVTHAGCDAAICDACVKQVKAKAPFKEVMLTRAGCAISSHCGRNTLGVLFIRKHNLV